MASFKLESGSLDTLVRQLESMNMFDEDTQEELLNAGADHLIGTIRKEAGSAPYRLDRIAGKVTKSRKIKKDKNGNYYLTVTPNGKNSRGERNATVAFVLNYGRSEKYGKITGCYFWTRAVKSVEKTVTKIYADLIDQKIKEKGLE